MADFAPQAQSILSPHIKRYLKDKEGIVYLVRIDGKKPDDLALLYIYNALFLEVGSGWHHVYRGMLSMRGQELLKYWEKICQISVDAGYMSPEEKLKVQSDMQVNIRQAG